MLVVDTNLLLYAADENAPEHRRSRAFLEECRTRSSPWYLTWGIVYEFLRVATHPRVFRRPLSITQAWSFVEAVLESPSVGILVASGSHERILAELVGEMPEIRGNLLFDARIAALMREHGIRTICTRDTDFHRFPFLEVVDPVSGNRRRS